VGRRHALEQNKGTQFTCFTSTKVQILPQLLMMSALEQKKEHSKSLSCIRNVSASDCAWGEGKGCNGGGGGGGVSREVRGLAETSDSQRSQREVSLNDHRSHSPLAEGGRGLLVCIYA
jgi:hypothetical protein